MGLLKAFRPDGGSWCGCPSFRANSSPSDAEVLSHFGKSVCASEPPNLQVGRWWMPWRRRDSEICDGRSRAAEHQSLRKVKASRTFERVALKCDLRRWIAPRLHLHQTHLSATGQALHRSPPPLDTALTSSAKVLIVSSVSNHAAFAAGMCVLDARILHVTIGGGAASSHERPRITRPQNPLLRSERCSFQNGRPARNF
jgi:hypothetical protein